MRIPKKQDNLASRVKSGSQENKEAIAARLELIQTCHFIALLGN